MKDRKKSKSILKGASFFLATFAFVGLFAMGTRFVKHKNYDVYNQEMVAMADIGEPVGIVYMDGATQMNYNGSPYFLDAIAEGHEYGAAVSTFLPTASIVHKSGYIFDGWYNDSGLTDGPVTELDSAYKGQDASNDYSADPLVFYAKWEEATKRSVTAQAATNGSFALSITTSSTDPNTAYVGDEVTVTSITPDAHYSVDEVYYTKTDGTGKQTITNNKFYAPDYNIYVYVTFVETDYAITYKDEGDVAFSGVHGTGAPTTHTYFDAEDLVNPTKAGYRFLGWFTDSACTAGNEITAIPVGQEDYTVYAKWEQGATIDNNAWYTFKNTYKTQILSVTTINTSTTNIAEGDKGSVNESIGYNVRADINGTTMTIYSTDGNDFYLPENCTDFFVRSYAGSNIFSNVVQINSSYIDTSNVTNMSRMFSGCQALTSLDLSGFNTSNVTNMTSMFSGCQALTNLDLSSFVTVNVIDMPYMFQGCAKLVALDLSSFDMRNVTNSHAFSDNTFGECYSLTTIYMPKALPESLSNLSLYKKFLKSTDRTFCSNDLMDFTGYVSAPGDKKTITCYESLYHSYWDEFTSEYHSNISNIEKIETAVSTLNQAEDILLGYNVYARFCDPDANEINRTLKIFSTTTNKIILPQYCNYFFDKMANGQNAFQNVITMILNEVDTSNVTNMSMMFSSCLALTNITFGNNFNTSNVISMAGMFFNCQALTSLDLSSFNTSSVTEMGQMFSECRALTSLDLSSFDTTNITSMGNMFLNCWGLTGITFGNDFNTSSVTEMGQMFRECRALTSLDLSSFNMSVVTYAPYMFNGCTNLAKIYMPNTLPNPTNVATIDLPGSATWAAKSNYATQNTNLMAFGSYLSTAGNKQEIVRAVALTIDTNEYGTVDNASVNYFEGQTVTIHGNDLKIDGTTVATVEEIDATGYTTELSGWTGVVSAYTAPATITANFTRSAQAYTITYKDQGGGDFSGTHGTGYPTTHTYFDAENLVNPTKAGYRFLGWFTDSACTAGNEITAIPVGQEDYTVYAKWGVTYAVTADPGVTNGTLSVDISQALAGEEVTVTANANTGYALTALYYIEAGDVRNTHHDINQTTKKFNAPAVAVTVYAEYTIQSYTITFNSDGGSEVAAITQNYGTAVTAPTDPTKEGYTFAGWSAEVPPTMPAENITLTAQWNENYTITIVGLLVSDTYTGTIPETYHVGSADITLPADVTRTGYTFNGWTWEGQSTPTTTAVITTGSTGNKTFTANFTAQTYAITYKDQGNVAYSGSNYGSLPTPHTYDATTNLVAGEKDGYRFLGWHKLEDCSDTAVTSIGATEYTADFTLYAEWAQLYTVSVASGITHGTVSAVVEAIEGEVVTVTVTPDAGYQLATLWFSAATTPDATAENINQTTKQFTMLAGNTEITATFTAIQYTITCINDGDSSNQYFTVETDTFNLVNPTKTGYTFTGWSGTGLTGEDNMTVTITQGSTGDRTYTAHYSKDTYTITYTLHDGSVASANPANYQVDTAEFTLTNPTKTGYTFTGWSGTDLTGDDNMIVTVTEGSTGNRTYEAHFTPITYTITKVVDGQNVYEYYTIETATFNLTNPSKTGYTFTGWTGDNGSVPETTVTIAQGSTGARSYTANFTAQVYYITYKDQGDVAYTGTNSGSLVATHTYDTTTTLVDGVKTGYRFLGWYDNQACTGDPVTSIGATEITAPITLYAKWAQLYTVSDSATTNGSFNCSVSEQIAGESVVVNVSPDSHYALYELYYVEAGSSTHNAIYMNGDDEYEFTMPAANVTIYATFAAIQYNITNNVNPSVDNGALSFSPSSAPYGATITVTITPNTGYEVTGLWYYTDDPEQYTLIAYNANTGTFNMPGDVVVCASFQAKTFTVLYEKQGGGDLENDVVMPDGYPTTHTYGTTTILPVPTREGYRFMGWYNDAPCTGAVFTEIGATAVTSGSPKFYAKWAELYSIGTNVNVEGYATIAVKDTNNNDTDEAIETENVTATIDIDTRYQLKVNGLYYIEANDANKTHHAITSGIAFAMPADNITIYVEIEKVPYAISTVVDVSADSQVHGTISAQATAGWNDEVVLSFAPYANYEIDPTSLYYTVASDSHTNHFAIGQYENNVFKFNMPDEAVTIHGSFKLIDYTITDADTTKGYIRFMLGSDVISTATVGTTVTVEINPNTGYKLNTLYYTTDPTDEDENARTVISFVDLAASTTFVMPGANIKVVATFTGRTYTVTFDPAGGTMPVEQFPTAPYEQEVVYDQNYGVLPTPTRTGYDFDYWYFVDPEPEQGDDGIIQIPDNQVYDFAGDLTLTAHWTAQQYTISYKDENDVKYSGKNLASLPTTHTYGTATPLVAGVKTGYRFLGWYDNVICTGEAVETIAADAITANQIYYAKWEAQVYKITYMDKNDGENPVPFSGEHEQGYPESHTYNTTTTLDTPTKTGYSFQGWYDNASCTGSPVTTIGPTDALTALTFYALWEINSYTITFNSNGGSAVSSITQNYGTAVTAPANPTRTGYTFTGWAPAVPETMPAVNQTLVAQWSVNSYKIFYKDQGNEDFSGTHGNGYPTKYVYDQLTNLVNPTKDGYTFKGWFTDPDCVYVITKIPASSRTGDLTVYAKWAPNNYNIILIVDGDYFRQYPYNVTTKTFLVANPTKTGYNFVGWTDGNIEPTAELYIEQGSSGNKIYTAVFEAKTYDISYVNYDGETAVGSLTAHYTYDQTTPLAPATKTGYDFIGWDLNGQTINQIAKESVYGDIQLEPVWQAKQYPITYKDQGNNAFTGTFTTQYPLTYTFEQEEPLTNPTRTGYDFVGWYTDSACTDGNEIEAIPYDQAVGGITVYAKWTAQEYTITYKDQNNQDYSGLNEESLPDTHTYNVATVLVAGVRNGYTFGGWYTDSACTAQVAQIGANTRTANFTLYAKWINNSYDIVYRDQGDVDFTGSYDGLLTKYTHDIYNNLVDATRPGYDFQGWYKDQDCATSRVYSLQDEIGEVTLYAKWTNRVFTVGLNTAYGDTGLYGILDSDNYTTEVTYLGQYGELETPHLDHYDFLGWYSDFRFDNKVESTTIYTFTNNTILYAKWAPTTYTLTLNIDGRTEYVTFDVEDEAFTVENPTKTGYTFTGWTRVDNDHDDDYGMNYAPLTHLENHTLTARFEVTPYTYTLVPSDEIIEKLGQATFNDMEVFSGYNYNYITEEITLPNVDLEEYGYTFIGWTGEGTEEATIGLTIPFHSTGDRTYTAHFTGKTYTLSFDTNGGEVDDPSKEVQYEEGYGELPVPTRENYTFVGWFDDEENEVTAETIMSVKEGISIHARWATVTYRIKKVIDTGIAVIQLYNVESNKITLQPPTKRGYKFIGWTGTGLEEITKNVVIPTGSSGDKTFIAHFELATYTITTKVKNEIREIEYTLESEDITLPDVNIPGYAFKGWIGEDVLTPTKELVIPTGSIGNRVYTASLRALTYFITLTNDSENTRIRYTADDEDFELPTLEKEGYVFAGWLADGETEPVKNLVIPSGTTGDKHYTAVWTEYEEPAPSEEKKDNKALTIGLASAAGVAVAGGILAGAFTFVKKKKKF